MRLKIPKVPNVHQKVIFQYPLVYILNLSHLETFQTSHGTFLRDIHIKFGDKEFNIGTGGSNVSKPLKHWFINDYLFH